MVSQLEQDRTAMLRRRQLLIGLGASITVAGAAIAQRRFGPPFGPPPGAPFGRSYPDVKGATADGTPYVAFPPETEGPFPADGTNGRGSVLNVLDKAGVVRNDLRSSFGGMTGTADGVPLQLNLRLVDADHDGKPLASHALYVWHCDAAGRYSLYNIANSNYLRGLGIADANGHVTFRTIYPGCYMGRFPHIHFELFDSRESALGGRASRLTSQLALPPDTDTAIYRADPRYPGSSANFSRVTMASDGVFGDNTPSQRKAQTLTLRGDPRSGYVADAIIAVTRRYA